MTATTTMATETEPEPERDVDRQNTAATVVSSVAVAPAAKSVVAVSAKFVAALAVGATAVVAPFVMGGSSNSLAPGPTSSLSSRLRDVNFFNSRGRSLNSYEGPNWRAMERAEATAAANVAPLQQRLAEMEEELRQANDELERAREEVDNAAKTRRKLAQAQTEASEASAREAAAVADRDAVWKALRGQLSDAAKARATMADHVRAMLALQAKGAHTFDYGNNLRAEAEEGGVENAFDFPGFVPAYIRPLFCHK